MSEKIVKRLIRTHAHKISNDSVGSLTLKIVEKLPSYEEADEEAVIIFVSFFIAMSVLQEQYNSTIYNTLVVDTGSKLADGRELAWLAIQNIAALPAIDANKRGDKIVDGSYSFIFHDVVEGNVLKYSNELDATIAEIYIMTQYKSDHILPLTGLGYDGEFIVTRMPYGTPLESLIVSREVDVASITQQLLEAVAYLHRADILHRDIKASNIIVIEGRLYLIDFNVSTLFASHITEHCLLPNTFWYREPAFLRKTGENRWKYSFEIDVWAVGIVILEMQRSILLEHEWKDIDNVDGYRRYVTQRIAELVEPGSWLSHLLDENGATRWTIAKAIEAK